MKRARRCSVSWARRAKNLRFSSGVTLVSHRGGLSCGLPMSKGTFVTSFSQPARSCARVAHCLLVTKSSNPSGREAKKILTEIFFSYLPLRFLIPVLRGLSQNASHETSVIQISNVYPFLLLWLKVLTSHFSISRRGHPLRVLSRPKSLVFLFNLR